MGIDRPFTTGAKVGCGPVVLYIGSTPTENQLAHRQRGKHRTLKNRAFRAVGQQATGKWIDM